MKKLTAILLLLTILSASAVAQCFILHFDEAVQKYNSRDYKTAKQMFLAAKVCPDATRISKQKADQWITKCNGKIKEASQRRAGNRGISGTHQASGKDWIVVNVGQVSFTMVRVDGGTFTMGCTDKHGGECDFEEKPAHRVSLSTFFIGETEVTQALWQAVMGDNPSHWKGDDMPVESVSYDDCLTFIGRLNSMTGMKFCLPTEAQWEYAARGGKKAGHQTMYAGSNNIENVAWYFDNSGAKTHPVKLKAPNDLGLYDMSGNVLEWCQDRFGDYSHTPQTNPMGPSTGSRRVLRGGCWFDNADGCRVACRYGHLSGVRRTLGGMRLALVPYFSGMEW